MLKKTFSSLYFLSFISLGILTPINAAEQPAIWLKVTASGVPGSAPGFNNRISTTGNTKSNKLVSNKECDQNTGKTIGALAGGLFGSSRFKSNRGKIIGAASGAIIGAGAGSAIDGC
tara:strand:+ start:148 stop:498 length:351 start_codon:yes stop_codon:yes gene_type:complete